MSKNTTITEQQNTEILKGITNRMESINRDRQEFDIGDGRFTYHLMDMFIDCKKLFFEADADYWNENIMRMFERATIDRGDDGLVQGKGEHKDLENTPEYLIIKYDFINELFLTVNSVCRFLSRMEQHFIEIRAVTNPEK